MVFKPGVVQFLYLNNIQPKDGRNLFFRGGVPSSSNVDCVRLLSAFGIIMNTNLMVPINPLLARSGQGVRQLLTL